MATKVINLKNLNDLFLEELKDMYSAEKQIVESLPKLIKLASFADLNEALSNHFKETQFQVKRLEKIFSLLDIPAEEVFCDGMAGILKEADVMLEGQNKSATLDAAIISCAQKVEHYEIASYGTLHSFAQYLELNDEIIDLLQETLDEEGDADETLTRIAEGTLFTDGVNKEALPDRKRK